MKRCQGDKHNSTNLKDLGLWTNLSLLHRNEQVNFFTLKRQVTLSVNSETHKHDIPYQLMISTSGTFIITKLYPVLRKYLFLRDILLV